MTWLYIIGYVLIGIILGAVGIAVLDFDTDEQWGFAIICSIAWPLALLAYATIGLAALTRLVGVRLGDTWCKIRRRDTDENH